MKKSKEPDDQQVIEGKVFAILSYLSILCIIPLLLKKDNKFVLSHGKNGLVIFVAQVAIFIIHIVLGTWFLKFGSFILGVISFLGIIAVLKGEKITFPIISDIADKITL